MDESSSVRALTFQFDNVLIAAGIAGLVTLVLLLAMLTFMPRRFPMNPLYLIGSAVSIETTTAYLWGIALFLLGSVAYATVIAAVQIGFEVEGYAYAWGVGTGLFLFIVTGTTLAYARNLNRAVRARQIGDPGSFMLSYGKLAVVQLAFAHILFGAVAGQLNLMLN